jgi:hypothetical protein
MLGIDVIDHNRQVTVAVAQSIGLGAPLVDRQLQLEPHVVADHIDQGEGFEVQPLHDPQAKGLLIKGHGAGFVDNADHRVNKLGHL